MTIRTASAERPGAVEPLAAILRRRAGLLVGLLALVALVRAAGLAGLVPLDADGGLIDFQVFLVAARMALQGTLPDAYGFETMGWAEAAFAGWETPRAVMPWNYPPQFGVVVAPLGLLPPALAYLLFVGAGLAAFLLVLRRAAGAGAGLALGAFFPALVVTVGSGQNGLLTAALLGGGGLLLLRGRTAAGLPLGLMAIKPHLAVTLALVPLVEGRWRTVGAALAVVALGALAATLLLGTAVWPAFLKGAREAGIMMEAGLFPLHRMVSPYAAARTLLPSPGLALAVHVGAAAAALAATAVAVRRFPPHQAVGLALMLSPAVSPYAYDYDLAIAAMGFGFVAADVARTAGAGLQGALLALGVAAGGCGAVQALRIEGTAAAADPAATPALSLGAPLLAGFVVLVWRTLDRQRAADAAS